MLQPLQQIHVLLVEDDEDTARLVGRVLSLSVAASFVVTRAGDLQSALALIEREPFDVVLLDLTLPDGGSMSTLAAAGAIARHVPIAILTSTDEDDLVRLAARIGVQEYLVKGEHGSRALERALLAAIERHRWMRHRTEAA